MKRIRILLLTILAVFFIAGNAMALPYGDGGANLDGVLNSIATDGDIDLDVTTDYLNDNSDSYWKIGGSGGAISTFIIEVTPAADDQYFGIYDRNDPNKKVQLFGGAGGPAAGDRIVVGIKIDGSVVLGIPEVDTGIDFAGNNFGFYLDGTGYGSPVNDIWYSDSDMNSDGDDHMVAFEGYDEEVQIGSNAAGPWGSNEYVLGWEAASNGDDDYDDFVVMVESISNIPIPEPATIALLGLGLLGVAGISRRKK